MVRPKRFDLLPPRFVVWAGSLKSLKSVTIRRLYQSENGIEHASSTASRYHKETLEFSIGNVRERSTLQRFRPFEQGPNTGF
jgi:hypothetical protein